MGSVAVIVLLLKCFLKFRDRLNTSEFESFKLKEELAILKKEMVLLKDGLELLNKI